MLGIENGKEAVFRGVVLIVAAMENEDPPSDSSLVMSCFSQVQSLLATCRSTSAVLLLLYQLSVCIIQISLYEKQVVAFNRSIYQAAYASEVLAGSRHNPI